MAVISNWLCAIAIALFAAAVQSQVQENSTKQPPPTLPPFNANDQCKYDKFKSFFSLLLLLKII